MITTTRAYFFLYGIECGQCGYPVRAMIYGHEKTFIVHHGDLGDCYVEKDGSPYTGDMPSLLYQA